MSTTSPVDPESAGLRRARVAATAAVLETVLRRGGLAGAASLAACAARGTEPAVASLALLATGALPVPWDGLVHRRVAVVPARSDRAAAAPTGEATLVGLSQVRRSGWWSARAEVDVGGVRVRHDLARRLDPPPRSQGQASPAPVPVSAPLLTAPARPRTQAHVSPVPALIPLPPLAGPERAPAVSSPGADNTDAGPGPGVDGLCVHLTPGDVAAWARATGDRNRIHLHPGAAREAGLPVGALDVVAHGLLLAALSLIALPPAGRDGSLDLRLVAPLALTPEGQDVDLDPVTGEVSAAGRVLVKRA